jgi:hypothetical protein
VLKFVPQADIGDVIQRALGPLSDIQVSTVDRTAFSAEGLTAGVKLQNSSLSRALLTFVAGIGIPESRT